MEFQEVVRRRRMVRRFVDRPGRPRRRSTASSTTPSGHRRPDSARAGRSWCSRATTGAVLGARSARRGRRTRRPGRCTRRRRVIVPSPTSRPTSTATPSPTRRGSAWATRRAGPCPTGTSTSAFACQSMLLTAVDLGLGALFFGIFTGEDELLGRPRRPRRLPAHRRHRPRPPAPGRAVAPVAEDGPPAAERRGPPGRTGREDLADWLIAGKASSRSGLADDVQALAGLAVVGGPVPPPSVTPSLASMPQS